MNFIKICFDWWLTLNRASVDVNNNIIDRNQR